MRKKVLRILAIIGVLLGVTYLIYVTNVLLENTLSRSEVKEIATKYIAKKYKSKDYYVANVDYFSLKQGCFDVLIKSKSSKDSYFCLDINIDGEIMYDSYKSDVEERYNTVTRINEAYDKLIEKAFSKKNAPYKCYHAFAEIKFTSKEHKEDVLRYMKECNKEVEDEEVYSEMDYDSYYLISDELELDKNYNVRKLGKKAGRVYITIIDKKASVKKAAEYMLKIKDFLDKENIPFYAIDFSLWYSENYKEKYSVFEEDKIEI